jgi:predicted Zn-dependent protease
MRSVTLMKLPLSRRLLAGACVSAAACLAAAIAVAVSAPPQQRIAQTVGPIDEVVLYRHADLKRTDFVDPLVCALRRVLVAPVNVADAALPLGPELMSTPTQYDAGAIAQRMIDATAADGGAGTFKYLLQPHDMKDRRFRVVFATSYANTAPPYHAGVVSMARLDVDDGAHTSAERAEIAAGRAYKLILRSVALLAGLPDSGGCMLAFSSTVADLDHKSAEFCPADREALIAAKVLKAQEGAGCMYVGEVR